LFGTGKNSSFKPIWTKEELEEERRLGNHIRRFKGLGEFCNDEIYKFVLDKNIRQLTQVQWSNNYEKLFSLMSSPEEKRKLVLGEWKIN